MSQFQDVQEFVRTANRSTTLAELGTLLEDVTQTLGCDYFALTHHVDLLTLPEQAVSLSNYPKAWGEVVLTRRYYIDDPVHAACQKAAAGFLWSDIGRMMSLSRRQADILVSARREGLAGGYTVPVHVPGEFAGSCSFGLRAGRELDASALPALQSVGCFAFEAARRIARRQASRTSRRRSVEAPPQLTERQLDCVVLVAKGRSDREIAAALTISEDTAHKHVENAKARYGVPTRTELVVRALFDAQLAFADVVQKRDPIT